MHTEGQYGTKMTSLHQHNGIFLFKITEIMMMIIDVIRLFIWFMEEFLFVLHLARNRRITEYNRQAADMQKKKV
jgi:hypothetical protein